jgi:predicted RNase H-like HicB family nuclease
VKHQTAYTVVIEREEDGRFSAYVPDLPGCASMGDTRRQAIAHAREAIACYLEGLQKLGRRAPKPRASFETLRVKAA